MKEGFRGKSLAYTDGGGGGGGGVAHGGGGVAHGGGGVAHGGVVWWIARDGKEGKVSA